MQVTMIQRFNVLYSLQESFLGQFSADESNAYKVPLHQERKLLQKLISILINTVRCRVH